MVTQAAGMDRMPKAGDVVGRYRLLREIGRGGMAVVFAAEERDGQRRQVACKILLPHLRSDTNTKALFAAEARLGARIASNRVARPYEAGQDAGVPFLAMELLVGQTVEALVASCTLETIAALAIIRQTALALAAAHAATDEAGVPLGVVHRDVSPQNIHVGLDGCVKLLDFGIAASRERHRFTRTGELRGKFQYLAPEQITRAQPVTAQADVWALGVVARELLTGSEVFRGENEATTLWNVTAASVAPLSAAALGIDAGICDVLNRCLQRDPDLRPTAEEVAAVLAAGQAAPDEDRDRLRVLVASCTRQGDGIERAVATARPRRAWQRRVVAATAAAVTSALVLWAVRAPEGSGAIAVTAVAPATASEVNARVTITSMAQQDQAEAAQPRAPATSSGTASAANKRNTKARRTARGPVRTNPAAAQGPSPLLANPY